MLLGRSVTLAREEEEEEEEQEEEEEEEAIMEVNPMRNCT